MLSAKQMGAERIIAMSRHPSRQTLAREFGATDIVTERGEEGIARIKDITNGIGVDAGVGVCRHVRVDDAGDQIHSPRRLRELRRCPAWCGTRRATIVLHSRPPPRGSAPVRRFLPKLIDLAWNGKINPGKVFDLVLPLEQVADGYRAMDERRAIKALLRP